MNRLVMCPSCSRHVRASEEAAACPFCDAIVIAAPPARGSAIASSRAARYARNVAVATGIVAATACGSSEETGGGADASAEGGGSDAAPDRVVSGDDSGGGGGDDASNDVLAQDAPDDVVSDRVCCPPYGCVFPEACGSVIA
ncbi:MAG TPA: hypothetical protein VIF62_23105 [Labilithrix sp.]|jgi:hypothetical protein